MVICSFALHLIESPSELFALLWELSTKSRWLIILAPHKKPEVRVTCFFRLVASALDDAYWMIDQRRLGMDKMECWCMGGMSDE